VAHVEQRHTFDVLWLEAWRAALWPNPFAHLLLPGLRLTHELLADEAASGSSYTTSYPKLLARLAAQRLGAPAYSALLQPFTFSFTLTRIAMLQNQVPVRRWKQWLVLPALGGLFFIGSHAALAQVEQVPSEAQQKAWLDDIDRKRHLAEHEDSVRTGGGKPGEAVVTVTRVPTPPAPPQLITSNGNKVFAFVEQMPQLPGGGGQPAIVQAIKDRVTAVYEKIATKEAIPAGRVFVRFIVDTDGTVQDVKIVKGLLPAWDAAVVAAVQKLPRFEPGRQNGQAVAVDFTVPIGFQAKP
jgi:TonB family protein